MAKEKSVREAAAFQAEDSADTMSLAEFAVVARLHPLYVAGLRVACLPFERTLAEWNEELRAFKQRPVRNC